MTTNTKNQNTTDASSPEPYIGVEQAAAFLSLPANTVYKKALAREIPSYKFGKLRRFRLSEIAAIMESKKVATDN